MKYAYSIKKLFKKVKFTEVDTVRMYNLSLDEKKMKTDHFNKLNDKMNFEKKMNKFIRIHCEYINNIKKQHAFYNTYPQPQTETNLDNNYIYFMEIDPVLVQLEYLDINESNYVLTDCY